VLVRNTTWTSSRDSSLGLSFTGVDYYDGQGFMVRKSLKVNSALELGDASVCVQQGTTTELNLADFFHAHNMKLKTVTFATANEAVKAYDAGRCDSYTTDASGLYAERLRLANSNDHIILPEIISKEPLGPAVRQGDDKWFTIVKWTLFAMINAEELGITSKNVDEMMKSTNPDVKRFVGTEGSYGEQLGLTKDWAVRIIKLVGNYGEAFERNVGQGSPLKIDRGLNKLWNKGGIQYAPPVRCSLCRTAGGRARPAVRQPAPSGGVARLTRGKCRLTYRRGRSPRGLRSTTIPRSAASPIRSRCARSSAFSSSPPPAMPSSISSGRISLQASAFGSTPPVSTSARH
jgi:general L-amino acid transport system substrate-binding protein